MVRSINRPGSHSITALVIIGLLLFAFSTSGQIFKKRNKARKEDKRSDYAYQTFSTTQRKERKKSFTGEAKFHFEKPLSPVRYGTKDREVDYSIAPYFGHKRPPIRRPPGSMKLCKVCGIKHWIYTPSAILRIIITINPIDASIWGRFLEIR